MKPRKTKPYTEEDITQALNAIEAGMSITAAGKQFNIPRQTLSDKLHKKHLGAVGTQTILSKDEELFLAEWIINSAKQGFPVTKDQLLNSVKGILDDLQRPNPFLDNRPGRDWYDRFMRRHPDISLRMSQNLTKQRSNVTEEQIRNWFAEINEYLEEQGLLNILLDPSRVYNCDETAFFLSPKSDKVLAKKGDKTVYAFITTSEKECLTTLIMVNALGQLPPPMVVYALQRIPKIVSASFPKDWAIGRSDNGWMTQETFFEYIANVFIKWLDDNNIKRPIILFVDGHTSHLTLQLSRFCSKNGIILISLYPNSTHILQPLDVALFRSLKSTYRKVIQNWRINHRNQAFGKDNFAPILQEALLKNNHFSETIQNGFRTCGLVPFNADNIKFEKFFKTGMTTENWQENSDIEKNRKEVSLTNNEKETFLKYFEFKNASKMLDFENARKEGEWRGRSEDTNLFKFWQKLKEENVSDMTEPNYDIEFDEEVVKGDTVEIVDAENIAGPVTKGHINVIGNSNITDYNEVDNVVEKQFNNVINNVTVVNDNNVAGPSKDSIVVTINPNVCDYQLVDDVIIVEENINNEMDSFSEFDFNISDFNVSATDIDLSLLQNPSSSEEIDFLDNIAVSREKGANNSNKLQNSHKNDKDEKQEKENEEEANNNKENISLDITGKMISNGLDGDLTPQKYESSSKINVPMPFKKHLFWEPTPDDKKSKTRKPKVKIPAVVTSEVWQKFQEEKEEKKVKEIKEKEERKQKRIEKQKEKKNQQLTKKPNAKELNPKYEQTKALNSEVGEFLVVNYEDNIFPGIIISINKENKDFQVKCMEKEGLFWKWPKKDDVLVYPKEHVVCAIQKPKLIDETKGIYEVSDMPKKFVKLFSK